MKVKDYNYYLASVENEQAYYDRCYEWNKSRYGSFEEYVRYNGERPTPISEIDFVLSTHYRPCDTFNAEHGGIIPYSTDVISEALKRLYIEQYEKRNKNKQLTFSEDKERIFGEVAKWFTNPDRKDGLMLCGGIGNGKTTLLMAIKRFLELVSEKDACSYDSAFDIIGDVKQPQAFYLIDDIGSEPNVINDYGTKKTPIRDLLLKSYERRWNLIVTTNLDFNGFVEHYDERTADRCREMFDKVIFSETSFRQ